MLHLSNLYHFIYVFFVCWMLLRIARRSDQGRMRGVTTIIQLTLFCFVVDLVLGFTFIDHLFGSSPSASWISKAIYIYPSLVIFFSIYFLRHRKRDRARLVDD